MRQTAPLWGAERVGSLLLGLGVYSLLGKATSHRKPYSYEIETSSKPLSVSKWGPCFCRAAQRWSEWGGAGLAAGGSFKLDFEWSEGWRRRGCAPRDSWKEGSELVVSRSEDGRDDEWSSLGVGAWKTRKSADKCSCSQSALGLSWAGECFRCHPVGSSTDRLNWSGDTSAPCPHLYLAMRFPHVGRPPYWATKCFNGSILCFYEH